LGPPDLILLNIDPAKGALVGEMVYERKSGREGGGSLDDTSPLACSQLPKGEKEVCAGGEATLPAVCACAWGW
jgi:hypothetical protein